MHRWLILALSLCAACAGAQSAPRAQHSAARDAGPLLGAPSALSNYDGRDASEPVSDASIGDAR